MKKTLQCIALSLATLYLLLLSHSPVTAQQTSTSSSQILHIFGRQDCQHCIALEEFITEYETTNQQLQVERYDIEESNTDRENWDTITSQYGLAKVTPIVLLGSHAIEGFNSSETTGRTITEILTSPDFTSYPIEAYVQQKVEIAGTTTAEGCTEESCATDVQSMYVSIPLLGVIDLQEYSLPFLAVVLGFIDGFNPCAMWVLVTFLVILARVGDKRKMWLFAGLFIVAEAIMYGLILTFWLTTWDFIGLDSVVTPIVGTLAIGGGCFFIYEFWKNRKKDDIACEVTNIDQKKKTTNKIKALADAPVTFASILGIIVIAFSVNIIEFACSIGIPQTFTKIIQMNNLGLMSSFSLLAAYILMYMIDDFIVFGLALWSFDKIGLTTKYTKITNLFGGILMILLGLMLIFKPDWLMF